VIGVAAVDADGITAPLAFPREPPCTQHADRAALRRWAGLPLHVTIM
jgi:hypothetical protein